MPQKIRWGILGPGGIAHKFADALKAIPDAAIVAVGSRDLQRADAFADTFDVPHRHGNYVELANNTDVDVIYVATPHPYFSRATSATLEVLGKDPLQIEIPFTDNGFEYQIIEVINCLRAGKLESDGMPLDESLSIIKTMDTVREQWGLKYPRFGSVL